MQKVRKNIGLPFVDFCYIIRKKVRYVAFGSCEERYDMKLSEGYLVKEIAGNYVLLPVGQNVVDYQHILHVNETGYFIVSQLKTEVTYDNLLERLVVAYEADAEDKEALKADLDAFLEKLREKKLLCE